MFGAITVSVPVVFVRAGTGEFPTQWAEKRLAADASRRVESTSDQCERYNQPGAGKCELANSE